MKKKSAVLCENMDLMHDVSLMLFLSMIFKKAYEN